MRALRRAVPAALALAMFTAGAAMAQGAPAPAGNKIAYVNPQALFDAAPGRTDAEAQFQKDLQGMQAQTKRMEDSLQVLITDYGKAQATLTAAQRDTRQKAIQTRQAQYQQRAQALEQQASLRRDELMQPIMETVRKALDDIRAEDGYAIILAADPGLILAADKNLDITERVVARLKTMSASRTTTARPAAATGAPVSAPAGVTRPRP